ncbi:MAG: inositol phosphorylceramide synthase [Aeromicrobium sp.]|nr:inositol phosphorylceramide synthase [Aeromicrobium sp.]
MVDSSPTTARTMLVRRRGVLLGVKRGAIELTLLAILYIAYSASRMMASDDFAPARGRALDILNFEKIWRIDYESWINDKFVQYDWLGVFGSFWYATTHYVVTAGVLIWLYRRSATEYVTARRALVVATLIGLGFYLLMPTAPPRLVDSKYADILSLHSQVGWWGADASAPKGLGHMTNELAAFPSLHAGWALWVALALARAGVPRFVKALGFAYAVIMAIVIVGTANHWVLDAIVGWLVVLVAFGVTIAWERKSPALAHEEHYVPILDDSPDP